MGRQGMSAALTRSRRRPFLGSCRWIWVLPPVALALVADLARRVDGQLFQFLVDGPAANGLFPLLDPLQVGLPLPTGTRGCSIVGSLRGSHLDEKGHYSILAFLKSLKAADDGKRVTITTKRPFSGESCWWAPCVYFVV